MAEVKGRLAALGQSVAPDASLSFVDRPAGEKMPVIILDRVVKGVVPEYCTHGYAECVACRELCWLGDKTAEIVNAREALALCMECAKLHIPPEAVALKHRMQVQDHRRADGPH